MKMKKEFTFVLGILIGVIMMISVATFAHAEGVTILTPDGTVIPLESLTEGEKQSMIKMMDKIAKAKSPSKDLLGQVVAADPDKLDSWRRLITGTIKDIANDLNVTVNEFIVTPVGMGVAGLIIYKVAGKDVLSSLFDIILAIPMWVTIMVVLFYLQRQYLGYTTVYRRIDTHQNDKNKTVTAKSDPTRISRYTWDSSDSRTCMACFLYGSFVVITGVTLLIVFV